MSSDCIDLVYHGSLSDWLSFDIRQSIPTYLVRQRRQHYLIRFGYILQDGTTAVHLASWKGHIDTLSYLLHSGGNVDIGAISGQTALHEAASAGQEAACSVLLKHGASTSIPNSEFQTASDLAGLNNFSRLAELLKPRQLQPKRMVRASCGCHEHPGVLSANKSYAITLQRQQDKETVQAIISLMCITCTSVIVWPGQTSSTADIEVLPFGSV